MTIVAIMTVPGMSESQYRTVRQALGEELQPGNLVHLAGPVDGGWQMIEVWESSEAMGAFFQSPAAGAAFQAAALPPVQPIVTQVDTLVASTFPAS